MNHAAPLIASQLRIDDAECTLFGEAEVIARIDAARKYAHLGLLLYSPSGNLTLDHAIFHHCKKRGIAVYLWYNVLFDNAILPEADEQVVDAFGGTGPSDTGEWHAARGAAELRFLACPSNPGYNRLVRNRCRQLLADYDGLFIDAVGFALPSFGLEMQFSCFCPSCLAREPRLEVWRGRVHELRERLVSADDGELDRWGTFAGLAEAFGLRDFFAHRARLVTALAEQYAALAREAGKPLGIDVASPALAWLAGHDLRRLAAVADWIKPRIYCRTYGPSSIPLEYRSLAMGAKGWAQRAGMPALMRFIGRSIGLEMPESVYSLDQAYLPASAACREMERAAAAAGGNRVFPGVECSLHPDFETSLDEATVGECLAAAAGAPGVVLGWNLLFIPDAFLKIAGGSPWRAPAR